MFDIALADAKKKMKKNITTTNKKIQLEHFTGSDYWSMLQAYYLSNKNLTELVKIYNIDEKIICCYLVGKNIGLYLPIFEDFKTNYNFKMIKKRVKTKQKRQLEHFTGIDYWYMLCAYHLDNKTTIELGTLYNLDKGTIYKYLVGKSIGDYFSLFEAFKNNYSLRKVRKTIIKDEVLSILNMYYKEGKTQTAIMKKHNIKSSSSIKDILIGKTNPDVYKEYFS